jgi:uncharacterized membrane protein
MKTRLDLLWLIPLAYAAASFALGLTIPHVEYRYAIRFGSEMSVSSAQAFLSSVTSGMMALTAIVFSLVFVFSQFSATAYSPRLTVELGRRREIYHAFGCFIATFTYSLVTLAWVDYGRTGRVPALSVCVVGALIAVSLLYLAHLIRSLARMNITFVLSFIGKNGRRAIDAYARQATSAPAQCAPTKADVSALPSPMLTLKYDGEPLSVAQYDLPLLTEQAGRANAVIVLDPAVGDTLVGGSRLLSVHGGDGNVSSNTLRNGMRLAAARTFQQDPKYAFRLLVDIAIRALSPAINDPTTAVQTLDQIEDLLSRLGQRELLTGYVCDSAGSLRVVFPAPTWEDFLALAFDEIRQYGRDSIQIMRRLRTALRRLTEALTDPARQEAVRLYQRHLDEAVSASGFDSEDRANALREDAQGIGVSRRSPT